jgi:hypothetical protein
MRDIGSVSLGKDSMENRVANLSIQDEFFTKPPLKFKSYKTGTLITNNGVPADAFIDAFPPPKPSPKPSQLSATTPAFVPRTPQPPATAANGVLPSLNTATPAFQRIQNLLKDLSSPANAGPSHHVPAYNPFYTPPASGSSSLPATHDYQLLAPTRPPRVYYQRAEKSKKDIIVTASGVTRNAVKVVEHFLPNGSPYHNYTPEFDGPEYNFVEEFKKMSVKEMVDLLANKQVEILVKLESYDREEKVEIVTMKKKRKGKKVQAKEGESSQGVDGKGKGKEKEDATQVAEEGGAKATTIIDTINTLGPDFASNTKSLCVTLDFTSIPSSSPSSSEPTAIPTGPRGTPAPWLTTSPLSFGPAFASITSLVRALQAFTALKHMVINLRVLSAHNSRPISIPQLTLVLPFYDLGFTDWKVSYCTEFLTSSVPVREWDYPLKWLDRERNKILRERERKLEGAVFVRRSSVEGKVARWKNQK